MKKKNNFMRNVKTTEPSLRGTVHNKFDQERLSVNQMHALSCFKPKEIFNINSDINFINLCEISKQLFFLPDCSTTSPTITYVNIETSQDPDTAALPN